MMNYPLSINQDLISLIDEIFDKYSSKLIKILGKTMQLILIPVLNVILLPILVIMVRALLELIFNELRNYIRENIPQKINNAKEYKNARMTLDKLISIKNDITNIQSKIEKEDLSWVFRFMFVPVNKIQKLINTSIPDLYQIIQKLDEDCSEGKYFRPISEQDLWNNRTEVYGYIL